MEIINTIALKGPGVELSELKDGALFTFVQYSGDFRDVHVYLKILGGYVRLSTGLH